MQYPTLPPVVRRAQKYYVLFVTGACLRMCPVPPSFFDPCSRIIKHSFVHTFLDLLRMRVSGLQSLRKSCPRVKPVPKVKHTPAESTRLLSALGYHRESIKERQVSEIQEINQEYAHSSPLFSFGSCSLPFVCSPALRGCVYLCLCVRMCVHVCGRCILQINSLILA